MKRSQKWFLKTNFFVGSVFTRVNIWGSQRVVGGSLLHTIFMDLRARSYLGVLRAVLTRPASLAVVLFRISSALYDKGPLGWFIAMVCNRLNMTLVGCEIEPVAIIGAGLTLVHPVGIVIGAATIGRNVSIYQGVTIGQLRHGERHAGLPVIGDDVVLYAGAVVVGSVTIGSGSRIGANAFVRDDVPDFGVAVCEPARVIVGGQRRD